MIRSRPADPGPVAAEIGRGVEPYTGLSPHPRLRNSAALHFAMSRKRMSSRPSASWFDPSQVFADTQRVDLFNDPPWVAAPEPSPRRPTGGE